MKYKLLIGLIMFAGFSIIGASIIVGIDRRDVTVEENPYEAGLKFDERLKKYAELGWRVEFPQSIRADENLLKIGVFDKQGRAVEDASVECMINKCGDSMMKRYKCMHMDNGYYQSIVSLEDAICMEVKANVSRANDTLSYTNKVYIER
jgi:nitrogen fixation protein FixH